MQIYTLQALVEIISGYSFRSAIENSKDDGVFVLQSKNVIGYNNIDTTNLPQVDLKDLKTKAFVQKNDVLFSSRGVFRAGYLKNDIQNTLASSSLYILRINTDTILPEFLAIYLNSQEGQKVIQKAVSGGSVPVIFRNALADIEIPLLPLVKQRQVIDIYNNWQKQEALLIKKISLHKNIAQGALSILLTNKI